jgi:hypothetical protein
MIAECGCDSGGFTAKANMRALSRWPRQDRVFNWQIVVGLVHADKASAFIGMSGTRHFENAAEICLPLLSPSPRYVYGEGDRHSGDDANESIKDGADNFSRPARSSLNAEECADDTEDRHHQDHIFIIATFDAAVPGGSIGPGQFLRSALWALPSAERNGLPAVMAGDRLHCSHSRQLRLIFIGERGGTRTLDPMIKSHVLYHLSYALTWCAV